MMMNLKIQMKLLNNLQIKEIIKQINKMKNKFLKILLQKMIKTINMIIIKIDKNL